MLLDLKTKSVAAQQKVSSHVHDAVFGETPENLYVAAHGKLALYGMSV